MESNFATVIIVALICYAVINVSRAILAHLTILKLEQKKQQIMREILESEDADVIAQAVAAISGNYVKPENKEEKSDDER